MIYFNLDRILKELSISRNQFSHSCGVRPNTINDMCNGNTKRIEVGTLNSILECLNTLSDEEVIVSDIIVYKK